MSSLLLSSVGVGSLIGRVTMGLVCDQVMNHFGTEKIVFTIIIGNIVNGSGNHSLVGCINYYLKEKKILVLAIIISAYLHGILVQIICSSVFGLTYGGYCTSAIVYLKTIFDDLRPALGLFFLTSGVSSLCGPIFVGELSHQTSSFILCFSRELIRLAGLSSDFWALKII